MSLEIEVLVPVTDAKSRALARLKRLGQPVVWKTEDNYFFDPLRPDLKPDASGRLHRCLRLRRRSQAGRREETAKLTWKDDCFDTAGRWICSEEVETAVEDGRVVATMLNNLGYRPLVTVKSEKRVYQTRDFEVVFEDVAGLGLFLEVESRRRVPAARTEQEKNRIRDYIASLGLRTGEELDAGKPELMLRRQAKGGSRPSLKV